MGRRKFFEDEGPNRPYKKRVVDDKEPDTPDKTSSKPNTSKSITPIKRPDGLNTGASKSIKRSKSDHDDTMEIFPIEEMETGIEDEPEPMEEKVSDRIQMETSEEEKPAEAGPTININEMLSEYMHNIINFDVPDHWVEAYHNLVTLGEHAAGAVSAGAAFAGVVF